MGLSPQWPLVLLLAWFFGGIQTYAPNSHPEAQMAKNTARLSDYPSHEAWGKLLKKHVDDLGNVNYSGFQKEVSQLDAYLKELSQNAPNSEWTKNQKLAFYINLYNAATVKLIVNHYPVKSIRDIPSRWKKKWIALEGKEVSLSYIEHQVLRKMGEPRIHFAINCASYSCPKLLNVPFTAQSMERLLSKTAIDFVNDTKRNRFEGNRAQLSKIFKWYKGDFTENKSLLEYINTYLENPAPKNAQIEFLDYDWSLNEAK
ncbi:DUF547 domain-containing protein [Flagellimonas flava]|uniref:DUF547 domain-containing protein n=1 Tax=Flagellimonas flava TaxID=570519 RepID=UPI003D65A3D0